jgi:hypothetical protein
MLRDALRNLRFPVVCFTRYYREGKVSATSSLEVVLESALDPSHFANPKRISAYAYEQTFARPLSEYLSTVTEEEGRKTIDAFIEFNKLLLAQPLIEKNFNIGDNFGLDPSGKIVLIDIGEIVTSKTGIKEQLRKRVWAAADVVRRLPASLQSYFVQKMDQTFSSYRIS